MATTSVLPMPEGLSTMSHPSIGRPLGLRWRWGMAAILYALGARR
jgi:hypothetical protein